MAAWLGRRLMQQRNGSRLLSCPLAVTPACSRGAGRVSSASGVLPAFQDKPRTVEDLPRVSFLELLYRLLIQGFYNRTHELQGAKKSGDYRGILVKNVVAHVKKIYEKELYGPIYRDAMKQVCVNSPDLLEELLRKDEKFPCRADMSLWKEFRDMKGFGYGPFTEDGENWYNLRVVLNKRMLHPKDSAQYDGVINGVVKDFIKKICHQCQSSPTGDFVTDMSNQFYLFSLEGIAAILFETRLGCLEKEIPAGTQEFINAIAQMFSNSMAAHIMPKWSRGLLPHWERYLAGWEGIFKFAKELIDKKLEIIQQRLDNNQDMEGEYLTYLLSNTKMSTKDVYGSVTELLLAGVDTTSNTLTWALHQLSKNPEIQDRLYQEVSTAVPAEQVPTAADVTRMPYLRAVIKETLRMYPVVPVNARVMTEKNVVVGGYEIPKKTTFVLFHYAMSQNEQTFPDSAMFKPERWLRDGRDRPHPFGSLPFGFGVRGCVGRRIAELEMYLLLTQLIRQFEIRPDPNLGELKSINRVVLVPDQQLNLHFVDRQRKTTA